MKSLTTFIGVLIVLSAIGALFYGGYLAIGYVWQLFFELDATPRLILLSSFAVFLLGCFIVAGALKSDVRAARKRNLQEAKLQLYKSLIESYRPCFEEGVEPDYQLYKDTLNKLDELQVDMQIVSSNAVIEAHQRLSTALANRDEQDRLNSLFQQLIKNVRQDLGHGSGYDETRLKFLLLSSQNKQNQPTGDKVQV